MYVSSSMWKFNQLILHLSTLIFVLNYLTQEEKEKYYSFP